MGSYVHSDSRTDGEKNEDSEIDDSQTGLGKFSGEKEGDDSRNSPGGNSPPIGPGGSGGGGGAAGGGVIPGSSGGEGDTTTGDGQAEDGEDDCAEDGPDDERDENEESEDSESEPEESEEETENEDEDEDDNEEQDEELVILQFVDPLSVKSWIGQPVMKRVEARYPEQVTVHYTTANCREFDDPEFQRQEWERFADKSQMPVDPTYWDSDPPSSTAELNTWLEAAGRQDRGEDFLRTLWRRGIGAGENVGDSGLLEEIAVELDLDRERLMRDVANAEVSRGEAPAELPVTLLDTEGNTDRLVGRLRYPDIKRKLTFRGLEEQDLPSLADFVAEHGPVATAEVMEVFELPDRSTTISVLNQTASISSNTVGGEEYWTL